MKQPISRNLHGRNKGVLAVYLQDGAPLTDAVWNEGADTTWSNARDAALDSGLRGTTGRELQVDPVYNKDTGRLTDFVLRGGPGRFYCEGIPISWPRDVAYGNQPCGCEKVSLGGLLAPDQTLPLVVWLETRVEMLDETDLPEYRDPAVQSDRGSFRRVVESCVRIATIQGVTPRIADLLWVTDGVKQHIDTALLPKSMSPSNVKLTVQGAYNGEENVHYRVELVKDRGKFDKYTHAVELLWDDRNASTVTRLVSDADKFALSIEVQNSEGFEPGDHLRLEGDGVDGQIYEVTEVDGPRLSIRRSTCCTVVSLAEAVLAASPTIVGDPADATSLELVVTFTGKPKVEVDDIVKDFGKTADAEATIPFNDQVWRVEQKHYGPGQDEVTLHLRPHFGLSEALSPWGEPLTLMQHAQIHEHCVAVEAAACWQPGMRVRISGKPRKTNGDPCWRLEDDDEAHECWPSRDPLFKDEDRTITWIERCRKQVECCRESHETMTLRLDIPLSADHSKCCDDVRPERVIKVRRYAGHECFAKLRAVWPCCSDTGGVCCMRPSFTLPSGLEVVLTYRGGTAPKYTPGEWWSFAARVGGWYEMRVFADPRDSLRGASLLALILPPSEPIPHQFIDLRPVPAMFDQAGLLAEIGSASAELAEYFAGKAQSRFDRAAVLAAFPRLQVSVMHHETAQLGLVELIFRAARDFVRTHDGLEQTVEPALLVKSALLAIPFRVLANATTATRFKSSLGPRELKTIADMLSRAASIAATIVESDAMVWPPLDDLDDIAPLPAFESLPECPDELPGEGDVPEVPTPADDVPDRPENPPDQDPDRPPNPDDIRERPENPDNKPPRPKNPPEDDDPPPRPDNPPDEEPPRPENPPDEEPPRPENPPDEEPPRPENPPDEEPPRPENPPDDEPPRPENPPDEEPPRPENPSDDGPPVGPQDLQDPEPPPEDPDPPIGAPDLDDLFAPLIGPQDPPDPPPGYPGRPIRTPSAVARDARDTSIGDDLERSDEIVVDPLTETTPANDIGMSGFVDEAGSEPDVETTAAAGVGELPTADLRIMESLNPSTAHRIVVEWPRLADVYAGGSEGAVRKRVIEAVRTFVADLRALFARPFIDESALTAAWTRNVRDGVPRPLTEVIARTLPASLAGEEE